MSVNVRKPGKSHDKRIHLEQPHEAVYWSKKFEVSSTQLLKAVKAVGSNKVDKVAQYLVDNQFHSFYR
jgi:hypothetical protein